MHWEKLPKVIRNEDEIREYERRESARINRLLKRVLMVVLPILLIVAVCFFLLLH